MIVLEITHVNETENYRIWDHEMEFPTIEDAKQWLKNEYPHKRKPMYVDLKDGSTKKTGYVYSKKSKYDGTGKQFIENIWVSFYEKEIKRIYL